MKLLSETAEYALRAAVYLAEREAAGEGGSSTQQIARQTQAPPDYLAKVLKQLARAGLFKAQRGAGGGFSLARTAQELNVLEVINAVDPLERIHACPLGKKAHGAKLCPLHRRIDSAMEQVQVAFAGVTLADLLAGGQGTAPALCR